jgi:hypothetical protein
VAEEALAERRHLARGTPPALPSGLRRREAAACAAMALGLINSWAVLAGPFSPMRYPSTPSSGSFGLVVAATVALGFREVTRGRAAPTRVVLIVLAAVAVAVG